MHIEERIVSSGHGSLSPSFVCIHETANVGATALNHVSYWSGNDTYAVHYVGDWTGAVYHCVPDDRLCWQVGNGNAHVIGIELCHADNPLYFQAVWETGIEWAAYMLTKHGWGVDRLISHDDARRIWGGTDHTDPVGYFAEFGRTWQQFKDEVAAKIKGEDTVQLVSNEGGPIYRLYNPNAGNKPAHHFTSSASERDWLKKAGWRDEGTAFTTKRSSRHPVYRMYNPGNGDHLFTADYNEAVGLQQRGWKYEGVPFFANPTGSAVYRMYNPNSGEHFMTASAAERDSLKKSGWKHEGGFTV